MRAVILLGTLKPSTGPQYSHTHALCRLLVEELTENGVATEIFRLADHVIMTGITTHVEPPDDWPEILEHVFDADIIVFATPVWWGGHSSLTQRVIERMDELNDEIVATGESELLNKAGGIVITGAEDGAEHIIGALANFMVWNGLTLPPACSLSHLGSYADAATEDALVARFRSQPYTNGMAKTMARNLAHMAHILKEHPLPVQEKGAQAFR